MSSHFGYCCFSPGEGRDDDYVDIDQHDEYVDPEEFMMGEGGSTAGESAPPHSPSASYSLFKPLPSKCSYT